MSRAIVVDDSKPVRMILARTLRELAYQVTEASDGRQALKILDAEPGAFQVALIDWNMPETNGMELLQYLRADPRHSSLVVLMVTTENEMEQIAAAIEAGANEYVMKPFTREILVDKLQIAGVTV